MSDERAMPSETRARLEPATANPWIRLESAVAFQGKYFRVRRDRVIGPDGQPGSYEYVEMARPFTTVVALDADGCVFLVRQWRYPWEESSWELPGGVVESVEAPLADAQRELAEEAGLSAASWQSLGRCRVSATVAVRSHLFLAEELRPASLNREGTERDMQLRRLPLEEALEAAAAGEISHAVSIAALFRAQRVLRARV